VDDAFYGVVPFYADPPEQEPGLSFDIAAEAEEEQPEEEAEPEIAGYIVGVPVPQGLYLPRFYLAAWEGREENELSDPSRYWVEGLTAEEIEELTKPRPQEPSELEQLRAENTELKLALTELAEAQEADKTEVQLALAEIAELVSGRGGNIG
jgi:hypothetical protein